MQGKDSPEDVKGGPLTQIGLGGRRDISFIPTAVFDSAPG